MLLHHAKLLIHPGSEILIIKSLFNIFKKSNASKTVKSEYDASLLVCSRCQGALKQQNDDLICSSCNEKFGKRDGYINMITDPALKTLLVETDYDSKHGISDEQRQRYWTVWAELLEKYPVGNKHVVEIGAGTGQLTWGLLHESQFENLHISDISPTFLDIIKDNYHQRDNENNAYYYLCDANELPFQEDSIDCLMGNSVLHHFAYYRRTLESVHKVLKSGGKAFFFEPVIQGKIFVALFLQLLMRADRNGLQLYDEKEQAKMQQMTKHITSQTNAYDEQTVEQLLSKEDKYIFDIAGLQSMAQEIGYSALHIQEGKNLDPSFFKYVRNQMAQLGLADERLQKYRWLFFAFEESIGKAKIDSLFTTPMVYLIFEK